MQEWKSAAAARSLSAHTIGEQARQLCVHVRACPWMAAAPHVMRIAHHGQAACWGGHTSQIEPPQEVMLYPIKFWAPQGTQIPGLHTCQMRYSRDASNSFMCENAVRRKERSLSWASCSLRCACGKPKGGRGGGEGPGACMHEQL